MSRPFKLTVFVILAGMFLACGTHRSPLGPAHLFSRGDQPIEIEAKSYSFSPNHLVVLPSASPRILRLTNSSDTWHNFTLVDPQGKTVLTRNLDPKESVTISADFLTSGNYVFYCDQFLHRYRGMEGMLMID